MLRSRQARDHPRAQLARRRRDRDDDLVGLLALQQILDLVRGAQDAQAQEAHAALSRVVVDEADRLDAQRRVELKLAHDHLAARAGADDQRAACLARALLLRRPLDPQARDDPGAGQEARS